MPPIDITDLPPKYQAQALAQLQQQAQDKKARAAAKENKYHAQPTKVVKIRFASKKEARRYVELMRLVGLGYIKDLRLQQDYTLQEAYTTPEGERIRAIRYAADFVYTLTGVFPDEAQEADREFFGQEGPGAVIIEDTKGCRTDTFKMKRKWMADKGYRVRET